MYSQLFCGTLDISTPNLNRKQDTNFLVKIYKIELSKYQTLAISTTTILSDSERNRAERYHFEKDRHRFIICRTLLKFLLAQHIDLDVADVIIETDSNKKPYLSSHPKVFFNVSHSGAYALIAIANNPIGVDVEYMNMDFDYEEILPSTFNPLEIDKINHNKNIRLTFYKFWTRKEAIVKAIGKGIDADIKKISVTDGMHSVPLNIVGDYKNINAFSFPIDDSHIGALAITKDKFDFETLVFCPLPTSEELLFAIA